MVNQIKPKAVKLVIKGRKANVDYGCEDLIFSTRINGLHSNGWRYCIGVLAVMNSSRICLQFSFKSENTLKQ